MILADENIDAHMVDVLRLAKIEVFSIKEGHQGISDSAVIELSKNPPRIILPEDKILENGSMHIRPRKSA